MLNTWTSGIVHDTQLLAACPPGGICSFRKCMCHERHFSFRKEKCLSSHIQPIAHRVAQHHEIMSKNFRFSARRTRILVGLIIYHLVLIVNPMGRILAR